MLKFILAATWGFGLPETILADRQFYTVTGAMLNAGADSFWIVCDNEDSDGWPDIQIKPRDEWRDQFRHLGQWGVSVYLLPCQIENNNNRKPWDASKPYVTVGEAAFYLLVIDLTNQPGVHRIWVAGGEETDWSDDKLDATLGWFAEFDPDAETTLHNRIRNDSFAQMERFAHHPDLDRISLQTHSDGPERVEHFVGLNKKVKIDLAEAWLGGNPAPETVLAELEAALVAGADRVLIWGQPDQTVDFTPHLERWAPVAAGLQDATDVLGGILGRVPLHPAHDRNGDGKVDVADLLSEF